MVSHIRFQLFHQLQRLSISSYAKTSTGELLSRFSNDLTAVASALTMGVVWRVTRRRIGLIFDRPVEPEFESRLDPPAAEIVRPDRHDISGIEPVPMLFMAEIHIAPK